MGKADAEELDIFVEDEIAGSILQQVLPLEVRKRCLIKPIGSCNAVLRQLASRSMEGIHNSMCVLDGDQSGKLNDGLKSVVKDTEASTQEEKDAVKSWAEARIFFLPGDTWPEKWLLSEAVDFLENDLVGDTSQTASMWGLENDDQLLQLLQDALLADKHDEFFELGEAVELDPERVRQDVCRLVAMAKPDRFEELIATIEAKLP
jgi:hypothetical protein